jgi:hypothetical protein
MRLLIAETSLSEDITTAANMLFFTVVGDFLLRLLLRKRPEPTDNEITARIEYTLAAFFRQFWQA